ncbi:MAG: sugar ABC transporter substrate-binding protein [Caldilineales bacterium]|nr:sugar ABC transporter substrate-binding protein [Caldilineales bacterium]MCW5859776.1 sugar ABC transporter substrate-binding protein [Caldilineales bacterium]
MSEQKKVSRREFLRLAGVTAGTAVVAAACAPAATPAPAPTAAPAATQAPAVVGKPFDGKTLRMHAISGANYDELYKLIPAWEEKTGAKVEFVFKGNGFETDKRLVQDLSAGTVDYDVCWDHSSFFSQYVKLDGLEPIDNWFSQEDLADFIPRLVDATKRDGHIWVMPRHFDISCMHYRTDLGISKAPETWDEFKTMALDVTKKNPGIFGTQFAGKEEALMGRFYEVQTAEGGQLFDDKWEPTFNGKAGVKAATMFAELYAGKAMPPDMTNFLWEDVAKQWVGGLIGMYTEWFGWYSYFQDPASSKVAGKFDIARQPMGDGKIHSGWAGHHGFSITKASKEKAMAADLIKHLTSVEGNETESKLGILVSRQSVWDKIIKEAETSTDPLAKKRLELALLQAQEDFKTPPLIAEWIPMSNIVFPILQKIILGDSDAQKGLDDAATQVRDMMKKAGYYG